MARLVLVYFGFTLALLAVHSCKSQQDIRYYDNLRVPILDGFETLELDSTQWKTFDELRIYLYQDPEGYYNYMIFWPEGREFFSSFSKIETLTIEKILTNRDGSAGYYSLIDNGILRESYAARRFLYDHYEMRADGTIIWTKRQTRIPGNGWKAPPQRNQQYWIYEPYLLSPQDSLLLWEPFW